MILLTKKYVLENIAAFNAAQFGVDTSKDNFDLKRYFVQGLNTIQNVKFDYSPSVNVIFEHPALVEGMVKAKTLRTEEVAQTDFLIGDVSNRVGIADNIHKALALIKEIDSDLHDTIQTLIHTIFICNINRLGGGSVTCYIGEIWFSPKSDWTITTYAENIIHEYTHQALFLDDMVNVVFPHPEEFKSPDAFATSSILKVKRPYDKAFHSAYVAMALIHFYRMINNATKCDELRAPFMQTVTEVAEVSRTLKKRNCDVLSPHGLDLLKEMETAIA